MSGSDATVDDSRFPLGVWRLKPLSDADDRMRFIRPVIS